MLQPTPGGLNWTTTERWMPWALLLCGVAAYANSLEGHFVFDDRKHIVEDGTIEQLWPPTRMMWLRPRPLTRFSFGLNHWLHGRQVAGYHLVNVAIHLLAGLTLWGITRRTLAFINVSKGHTTSANRGSWIAFSVALLWLVHPLTTQAVTYLVQRAESLTAMFYLVTLYAVIRSATTRSPAVWNALAVGACAMGMATKEVMVTAPGVILCYDRTFLSRSFSAALKKRRWLYVGLAFTWVILFGIIGPTRPLGGVTMGFGTKTVTAIQYTAAQPGVLLHYFKLCCWPNPLCFDYAWPVDRDFLAVVLPATLISLLLASTVWAFVARHPTGFLAVSFFLILAPTSSIMPIQDLAVEHRMYLPLATVIPLLVMLIAGVFSRCGLHGSKLAAVTLFATAASLAASSATRNADYHDETALWRTVLATAPYSPRAHYNYARSLTGPETFKLAVDHYRQAIALQPNFARAHDNLGVLLGSQGYFQQALTAHARAHKLDPRSSEPLNNIGHLYAVQGDHRQAALYFRQSLVLHPDNVQAHYNLAHSLTGLDKTSQAIDHLRKAIACQPDFSAAHNNLAALLFQQGQREQAIHHYRQAINYRGGYTNAHYNLGNALLEQGEFAAAARQFLRVLRLAPRARCRT